MKKPVITIDGPAGAGKSTVAKLVAARLGFRYLDTGSMYRAVTWKARKLGLEPADVPEMIRNTRFEWREGGVIVDGEDVSTEIRANDVSRAVKPIADSPECRKELVRLQQEFGEGGGLVTEGRDQGSVVFPGAEVKIYLDASVQERARRRSRDLGSDTARIKEEIEARDEADRTRPVGPLVMPSGAVVVDTTGLGVDEVVAEICRIATSP